MDMLVKPAEYGWLPDALIRIGIRRLVKRRLKEETLIASEQYPRLLDELSKHLLEKNNLTKTIYMQDQFYKMKKSFSKFFRSLEPITMEYLNPSIKKEFIDDDIFISKIFFTNSSALITYIFPSYSSLIHNPLLFIAAKYLLSLVNLFLIDRQLCFKFAEKV